MNTNSLGIIGLFLTMVAGGWTYTQNVNDSFTSLRNDIYSLRLQIQELSDKIDTLKHR